MVSFAWPVMLPVFKNDVRQPDVLCAGYIELGHEYDGRRNKLHIQPIANDPRFICALEPNTIGQSYTISHSALYTRVLSTNWAADNISCADCGAKRYKANTITGCCTKGQA